MSTPVQLIVGLGNPGSDYEKTRHNAGFWLLDELAAQCRAHFKPETKFHGLTARANINNSDVWLLKPTTFMNRSGQAVKAIAQFYKIDLDAILVAHDELDFAPGVVRLKENGGHGGHNGLRDIIAQFGGDTTFPRLRIGIGRATERDKMIDYVLGRIGQSEYKLIEEGIHAALRVIPDLVAGQYQRATNNLHTQTNKPI